MLTDLDQVRAFATVGFGILVSIAALFGVVWRALRTRWSGCFALGFLLLATNFLISALFPPMDLSYWQVVRLGLFVGGAYILLTAGILQYTQVPAPWDRRWLATVAVVAITLLAIVGTGALGRRAGLLVQSVISVLWAGFFLRAHFNQPSDGHLINLAAQCALPTLAVVAWFELLPLGVDRTLGLLTYTVMGLTFMCTSLLSANRQAGVELAGREHAEAQLRAMNASLASQVAEHTKSLRETIEGLEGFNRSVSHDLRGPLGGIAGVAELAEKRLRDGNAGEAARLLGMIRRQALDSFGLVEALLALARSRDASIQREAVDTEPLVREVVHGLQTALGAKPVDVQLGTLPWVMADRLLLRQVFHNLIANAEKFSAHRDDARIEVTSIRENGETVFRVRDNGVGFDPATAAAMFKPFVRLSGHDRPGFGVGLSIARRVVERHGGRIWADALPGQGATFYFTLGTQAMADAPAEAAATPVAPQRP